ncbi:hypothetical protein C8P63_103176 [Melghirimyces profundicolus]|uniref:Uncharacterized protein n=1 Tax=Melghirimyces profundicolus TaxID=1242148 RepID=A0A2T6C7U8_9BACL|nr:hypothetical protein C8P63_103176 [Melghirimyces profundicolus]
MTVRVFQGDFRDHKHKRVQLIMVKLPGTKQQQTKFGREVFPLTRQKQVNAKIIYLLIKDCLDRREGIEGDVPESPLKKPNLKSPPKRGGFIFNPLRLRSLYRVVFSWENPA